MRVGVSDETLEGLDPDTEYNRYDIGNRTADVLAQADLQLGGHQVLSVGASFERRAGEVRGGFDARADVRAVFAVSQWAWGDAGAVTAAVRRDDHSVFGGAPPTAPLPCAVLASPGRGCTRPGAPASRRRPSTTCTTRTTATRRCGRRRAGAGMRVSPGRALPTGSAPT